MRRRVPLLAALALLTAAAVWTLAWFIMADRLASRVEAWADARRAEGLKAEHSGIDVAGFPFRWQVTVARPTLAGAGSAGWLWHGDAVEAALVPFARREVAVRFPGEHVFSAGEGSLGGAWRMRADRPDGRVLLRPDGRLDRLELNFAGVALAQLLPEAAPVHVDRLTAVASVPETAGADHRAESFALILNLDGLSQVQPPIPALGSTIEAVRLDLVAKGRLPPGRLAAALAAWRDAGGTVEINRLAVRWGPIDADGNGTLTLDEQNRPLGAFTARWRGYNETIDALQATGQIPPWPAAGAKIGLNALARQQADGSRQVEIPLSAQNGRLFVAGFPLMRLAPLKLD
jgi:hypothetical protein